MKIILSLIFILLFLYFIYYDYIGKYNDSDIRFIVKSLSTIFLMCYTIISLLNILIV